MLEPRGKPGGLRVGHSLAMAAVVVVAAVVAWVLFDALIGFLFHLIEIVLVIAVVAGAVHLIRRSARK